MVKKAWYVYVDDDSWDEYDQIVFFESEEDLLEEFENYAYERKPQFDKYANEGSVPNSALYDDGWYFYCDECGRNTSDEDEDEDLQSRIDVKFLDSFVFCCQQCQDDHTRNRLRLKQLKEETLQILDSKLQGKLHSCSDIYFFEHFENNSSTPRVRFRIPGTKGLTQCWDSITSTTLVSEIDVELFTEFIGKENVLGID